MSTFDENGDVENGNIFVQLKATDHIRILENGNISFTLDRRDISTWEAEPFPVYLVVFNAVDESAYALELQPYFKSEGILAAKLATATRAVHIPPIAVSTETVQQWRRRKNVVLSQLKAALV